MFDTQKDLPQQKSYNIRKRLNDMLDLQIAKQREIQTRQKPQSQNKKQQKTYKSIFQDVQNRLNKVKQRLTPEQSVQENELTRQKQNMFESSNRHVNVLGLSRRMLSTNKQQINVLQFQGSYSKNPSKRNGYSGSKSMKKFQPFFQDSEQEDSQEYFDTLMKIDRQKVQKQGVKVSVREGKRPKKLISGKSHKSQSYIAMQVTNRLYSKNKKGLNQSTVSVRTPANSKRTHGIVNKSVKVKKKTNIQNSFHYPKANTKQNIQKLIRNHKPLPVREKKVLSAEERQNEKTNKLMEEVKKCQQKTKNMEKQIRRMRYIQEELFEIKKGIDLNVNFKTRSNTENGSRKRLLNLGKQMHLYDMYLDPKSKSKSNLAKKARLTQKTKRNE